MRSLITAALLLAAAPALADDVTGKVIAFDRVAKVIVLEDKTVFNVATPELIPEGLMAGDTVKIDFRSEGDAGVTKIYAITKQ